MVKFDTTDEEMVNIKNIIRRTKRMRPTRGTETDMLMDITAVHCNGNKLDLKKLLNADISTFEHDMLGIFWNIDRNTGKLRNHFVPQCSELSKIERKINDKT